MSQQPQISVIPKTFTARKITVKLFWMFRSASRLLVPRYTPANWWECDLWRLTKAGFVDEYEIKLTVADFMADVRKEKKGRVKWNVETKRFDEVPSLSKHDILRGAEGGPNRFWYVLPDPMVEMVSIPEYAGLITVSKYGGAGVQKQAPKRHGKKWEGDPQRILTTCYHRYWNHELGSKAETFEPIAEVEP